jgi:hypothetical protein
MYYYFMSLKNPYSSESPTGRRDVSWMRDTPIKGRSIGGKTKLDSNAESPRPHNRKFHSSPILAPKNVNREIEQERARKIKLDQKLCEELSQEFGGEAAGYKPRNILDTLSESQEESSTQGEKLEGKSKSLGNFGPSTMDDTNEFDDVDFMAHLEEEAKRTLHAKMSTQILHDTLALPKIGIVSTQNKNVPAQKATPKQIVKSGAAMDDDDDIMLSVPIEDFYDPQPPRQVAGPSTERKFQYAQPKNMPTSSYTTTNPKPVIQSKPPVSTTHSVQNTAGSNHLPVVPEVKRRCTPEEIEQKRQQALKIRAERLKNKNKQ